MEGHGGRIEAIVIFARGGDVMIAVPTETFASGVGVPPLYWFPQVLEIGASNQPPSRHASYLLAAPKARRGGRVITFALPATSLSPRGEAGDEESEAQELWRGSMACPTRAKPKFSASQAVE